MWALRARTTLPKLIRQFSSGSRSVPPGFHPVPIWDTMRQEIGIGVPDDMPNIPRDVDCLIIGGGLIGMSTAYWLKSQHQDRIRVAVVERDTAYTRASSVLSCGGVRHQFTMPENVQLSLFTSEFLREIKEHLSILNENDPPDVQFNHQGYLFLEGPENAEQLVKMVKMQNEMGAKIRLLSRSDLKEKFPWINLEDVEVGSYGLQGEGWFDPYLLLRFLYQKNLTLGVHIVHGELDRFDFQKDEVNDRIQSAYIKTKNGDEYGIRVSHVINCAGPWAREVALAANIGSKENIMDGLPVHPRKRYVYVFHCPDGPGIESPFFVDTTGVYFRREGLGGHYICGATPSEKYEPSIGDLSVDYKFFEEAVWPQLAYRVPKFENLKLKSGWAGYYDYNEFDQNLIIGPHPKCINFIFANGLSGHGVQHALGIGRGLSEFIYNNRYSSIDLSKFSFDRIQKNEPLCEINIV